MLYLSRAKDSLSYILFGQPAFCALCERPLAVTRGLEDTTGELGICSKCIEELASQMKWVCKICGMPLKQPLEICRICQKNMYYYDAQRSCGIYQGQLRRAIIRMKYGGERWLSRPLGRALARVARCFMPVDLIVPVPLEPMSKLERGFNQALDLAVEISRKISAPVYDILRRDRAREHQARLGREKRWENLRRTMVAKKQVDLSGYFVLLVDDVTTTGATLDEAARVLKALGANKVFCVTVARTVRQF